MYIPNLSLNHAYMQANEFQNCGQGSARMKRNTNAKTFKDIPMHPRWIAANAPNKLNIARRYSLALADFLAAGVFIWSNFIFFGFFGSQVSRFQNSQIPDYHVPTFSHFQIPRFPNYQIPAGTDGRSLRSQPDLSANAYIYIYVYIILKDRIRRTEPVLHGVYIKHHGKALRAQGPWRSQGQGAKDRAGAIYIYTDQAKDQEQSTPSTKQNDFALQAFAMHRRACMPSFSIKRAGASHASPWCMCVKPHGAMAHADMYVLYIQN